MLHDHGSHFKRQNTKRVEAFRGQLIAELVV